MSVARAAADDRRVRIWDCSLAEVGVASTELAATHTDCPTATVVKVLFAHCMLKVFAACVRVNGDGSTEVASPRTTQRAKDTTTGQTVSGDVKPPSLVGRIAAPQRQKANLGGTPASVSPTHVQCAHRRRQFIQL